jgi:Carboxypeptidase regulatory-like domain/TonB dependent receptor
MKTVTYLFLLLLGSAPAFGQTGTLKGVVTDESGGIVAGAKVTLTSSAGQVRASISNKEGAYSFSNVPLGEYLLEASASQLTLPEPAKVKLSSDVQLVNLQLKVAEMHEQVNVGDQAAAAVTTESGGNASAVVLRGKDLEALGDDPEDLAADLQAMAGPSAGPNGGAFYIDGFSGGQIPSKESILEVRINQNPFSPEYDTLGYGRIEILTKPGADKFHGSLYNNFGDSFWNSRNPYAAEKAPFLLDEYGASLEGPLSKKASFFVAADAAAIDNGAIINGTTLDPNTLTIIDPFTQVFVIPQRRVTVSPRVDYQLTPSDTLSVRYVFQTVDIQHSGVGSFNLVSTGFHNEGQGNTLQIADTKILGSNIINQTRFQFDRQTITSVSDNSGPQIDVLNAFVGGGAQLGTSSNALDSFEFQNYTTISHKTHTWHFGVRARAAVLNNTSPIHFGGTFVFSGGLAPELDANDHPVLDSSGNPVLANIDSIESYRRTLVFQQMGLSASQIRALGGGASQFSINAGNPSVSVSQEDVGAFVGDEWRLKRNLTINLGLRYEGQTNIHDWTDFAPRLGLAWAPGGGKSGSPPKTVIRSGFGFFYQRFDIASVLTSERYNGISQQQYVVTNPDFFPTIHPVSSLTSAGSQQAIEKLSRNLRAPYLMQSALSVERQLPAHTTMALTYVNSHSPSQFLTNDINAPLPGTYNPQVPGSGTYPLGTPEAIFQVGSSGLYNQNELIVNVNSRINQSVSLFGSYVYNQALSNTDYAPPPRNTDFNPAISFGAIGVGSSPANPYRMAGEYGPASTNIRNQGTFGGSIATKWGFSFNPLVILESGAPFNITVGQDLYGDTLFNGRPGIAVDTSRPGLVPTKYGLLDPNPIPGEVILPRNFGRGPGLVLANLRVTKAFAFGPTGETAAPATGGRRPPTGPFSTGGASGGSSSTGHRYVLSVSMAIRNIVNRDNPGPINGNVTSPLFGRANQPYGAGSLGGTGFSESADNRRLELQMRFRF